MQFLACSLNPMMAEKRVTGMTGEKYENARSRVQGQSHESFQVQNLTTNTDAQLLCLCLAGHADPNIGLASLDVSNAFLSAELLDDLDVVILTISA